jgi:hypothetical protein
MSKNILLISVQNIKDRTGLHNNVDEKLVNPEIKTSQDMYILPTLGSGLYNRLEAGVVANNLTANENILIDDYLADCLIYFVMSELPIGLSYQFYNKGLLRKGGENTENPSMQDMIDVANRYRARAEFYKERMIKYLQENQILYPEYLNFGSGIDAIRPDREGYSASIWLGDYSSCDNRPLSEKYQGNNGC